MAKMETSSAYIAVLIYFCNIGAICLVTSTKFTLKFAGFLVSCWVCPVFARHIWNYFTSHQCTGQIKVVQGQSPMEILDEYYDTSIETDMRLLV